MTCEPDEGKEMVVPETATMPPGVRVEEPMTKLLEDGLAATTVEEPSVNAGTTEEGAAGRSPPWATVDPAAGDGMPEPGDAPLFVPAPAEEPAPFDPS